MRKLSDMPGKLLFALHRLFASSSGSPWSEQTNREIGRSGKTCNFYRWAPVFRGIPTMSFPRFSLEVTLLHCYCKRTVYRFSNALLRQSMSRYAIRTAESTLSSSQSHVSREGSNGQQQVENQTQLVYPQGQMMKMKMIMMMIMRGWWQPYLWCEQFLARFRLSEKTIWKPKRVVQGAKILLIYKRQLV